MPLDISLERYYLKDALKGKCHGFQTRPALLHSILFHRGLQNVRPLQVDIDPLSLSYIRIDDPSLDALLTEKVSAFASLVELSSPKGRIALLFHEKKPKKTWFAGSNEACWEQWIFSITVRQARTERDEIEAKKRMRKDLQAMLMRISCKTCEQMDHIPPITSSEAFPFEVRVSLWLNHRRL